MEAISINNHLIGPGHPVYIIAELSANHNRDFEKAVRIIERAKDAGADAIKLQTYRPDTITLDCDNEYFRVKGTQWEGRTLYELYEEAFTPWEWQPRLKKIADRLGLDCFSAPFDFTAVDFLEKMDVPAYKVASFENVDIPLLRKIALTGKPIIMSTGMATLDEIEEAVRTIRESGESGLALLKCTSAYPAPPEEMNLRAIPHLAQAFDVPVGLSDHTLGSTVPVAAVSLGACIIEKHLTLSRNDPGPDSKFSMEPHEFEEMVKAVRVAEIALGHASYETTESEKAGRALRRSLFIIEDVKAGQPFTEKNVRSIRPGHGLHTRYLEEILKGRASRDLKKGTPLTWDCVQAG